MKDWMLWVGVIVLVVAALGGMRLFGRKDATQAHRLVAEGAALVDVRSPGEFASGHLDGALNVPVDQLARRAKELGATSRPVVVYCASGARSAAAANTLRGLGFEKVEDLGSIRNW